MFEKFGLKSEFVISVFLALVVISLFLYFGDSAGGFFQDLQDAMTHYSGWMMVLIVNFVLMFAIYLGMSRFKRYKIGGDDAEPEFSVWAWIAMLFAAGMGIGLLFYSVAEPLAHYHTFFEVETGKAEAAKVAMNITFMHWGLHPWAIYALVGLALSWFHFTKKGPLSFSAPLTMTVSPRKARYGGVILNVLAILGTLFGVCTSLGLGTSQASAGIERLTGWEADLQMQIILIIVVCLTALISVVSGVGRGIKIISQSNLVAAAFLMLFVLFAGETIFVLKAFVQHLGYYVNHFVEISTWTETYTGTHWQSGWTLFYWAWWISWSPFVGLFIARISRGRTIGEFIAGVLIIPSIFNFMWMTVFGANALHDVIFGNAVLEGVKSSSSLYVLLESLPFATFTIGMATMLVLLFFITSADSGALVMATLAAGNDQPSIKQRVFWSLLVLLTTVLLLNAGGLQALQTATVLTGIPFAMVMLVLVWALIRNLQDTSGEHNNLKDIE